MKIYFNSGTPLYIQIAQQFKEQIVSGLLKAHEPLPSVYTLSMNLKINVGVSVKAYQELMTAGLIYADDTASYRVTPSNEWKGCSMETNLFDSDINFDHLTKDDVVKILSHNRPEEILSKYTKTELTKMHVVYCGCQPRAALNKMGILNEIRDFEVYLRRNKALSEM